jgi:hypothetical protein
MDLVGMIHPWPYAHMWSWAYLKRPGSWVSNVLYVLQHRRKEQLDSVLGP